MAQLMVIKWRPWLNPFYPYRAYYPNAYTTLRRKVDPDLAEQSYYRIKPKVIEWIESSNLKIKYTKQSGRLVFAPLANGKKIVSVWHIEPPPILFRNKAGPLIMKLTLAGMIDD